MPKLTLTPEMLESAYEYLRVSPPFCRWNLPHADQVMFPGDGDAGSLRTFPRPPPQGHGDDEFSEIAISAGMVSSTDLLISTMAHEMIHLYQDETGTARGHHNPRFRKLAQAGLRHSRLRLRKFLGPQPVRVGGEAPRRAQRSSAALERMK